MNFKTTENFGTHLNQLNGKTVEKIFQVDYNGDDRYNDSYLPWLFFITFLEFNHFLEIEGDFDGEHIKINLCNNSELTEKLKKYNLPDLPDCWRIYDTIKDEKLGQLLGQKINFIEYGIDKDEITLNGTKFIGQKNVFHFITFHCENLKLTIVESLGLGISDNPDIKFMLEEVFDRYKT